MNTTSESRIHGRLTALSLAVLTLATLWPDDGGLARRAEAAEAVDVVVIAAAPTRTAASPLRRVLECDRLARAGAAALPRLLDLTRDEDPLVRAHAIAALSSSSDPRALAVLVAELGRGDWRCRRVAAEALSGTDSPQARQALNRALSDASGFVRLQAARALGLAAAGPAEGAFPRS